MGQPLISIIVPAHNEEGCLGPLHQAVEEALANINYDWEMIIVDDGSLDGTAEIITALHQADARVKGIHLTRNFGQQAALLAGLTESQGVVAVTIDADLEQPPNAIVKMISLWEQGYQVIHGVRRDHSQLSWFKRTSSRQFYRVFSFLSRIPMTPGMLDFKLLDRAVVEVILAMPESDFFLRGIAAWVGFKQAQMPYNAGWRCAGRTKYTTRAMVAFAMRGITSFSTFPLRLATYLGLVMTILSLGFGTYVGIRHFFWAQPQPGYASTVLLICFLLGIQFLLIGLLGEYVGRIHMEVKRRPRYIIARRTNVHPPPPDTAHQMDKRTTRR